MTNNIKFESVISLNSLLKIFFVILFLYVGQSLLIPLFYGLFIAIILYPLSKKLESSGINKLISISISLAILGLLFCILIGILLYEFNSFRKDIPLLKEKIIPLVQSMNEWLLATFGILISKSTLSFSNIFKLAGSDIGSLIKMTINNIFGTFFYLTIIPIYAALILFYRKTLVSFLRVLSGEKHREQLERILTKTIQSYNQYIKGMLLVYVVVGILNSLGLLMLGVKYAIFFGMLTAFMTMIPYIGIIISSLLPLSISYISTNSIFYPLGVLGIFSIVQYLEANFIFPMIVGKQLNINILVSIVGVFAGGMLWGVSGMILIFPLLAVTKIISDEILEWEPIRILISVPDHGSR